MQQIRVVNTLTDRPPYIALFMHNLTLTASPHLSLPTHQLSPNIHLQHRTHHIHFRPSRVCAGFVLRNRVLAPLNVHKRVLEVPRDHLRSLHALEQTGWRTLRRVRLGDAVDVRRDELDEVANKLGLDLEKRNKG